MSYQNALRPMTFAALLLLLASCETDRIRTKTTGGDGGDQPTGVALQRNADGEKVAPVAQQSKRP